VLQSISPFRCCELMLITVCIRRKKKSFKTSNLKKQRRYHLQISRCRNSLTLSFYHEIVPFPMVFLSSAAAVSGGTVLMYMPVLFSKPAQIARLG
jgi:hypothetical protein